MSKRRKRLEARARRYPALRRRARPGPYLPGSRLVRARPDESAFHYDLGFIYARLGRLQDATRGHARYVHLRRSHTDTPWLRTDGANDRAWRARPIPSLPGRRSE
jgi:hypothetical protein